MRCGIDRKVLVLLMIAASGPAVFAQQAPSTLPPGWVTPIIPGIVQEPTLLKKFINATDNTIGGDPQDGPYVEWGNMITGSGWISAGPGYRQHVLDGRHHDRPVGVRQHRRHPGQRERRVIHVPQAIHEVVDR